MNFANIYYFLIILFFCSCSARYENINLEDFVTKCFVEKNNKYLIYVNGKNNIYNFAMFDILGVPLSSKSFHNGTFSSNKFLRNKDDDIFYEILQIIKNKNKANNIKYKIEACK